MSLIGSRRGDRSMSKLGPSLIALLGFLSVGVVEGQQNGAPFIGSWKEYISGAGEVRLIIISVGPDGQIEGKLEVPGRASVSTFNTNADQAKSTNRGVVSGSNLTIALTTDAKYELKAEGDRLRGKYTRDTYEAIVNFRRF